MLVMSNEEGRWVGSSGPRPLLDNQHAWRSSPSNQSVRRYFPLQAVRTPGVTVTSTPRLPWNRTGTEPRCRHERPVSPGGPGRLPGRAEGGHTEGSERPGRGWDDTDPMGRLPRQPGGAPAHREQRVSSEPQAPTQRKAL